MTAGPIDLAQVRLDNAMALFEEFVRQTARHADAATLRGLERRFAERLQIQPSYWSQIKSRSRQIGERLARQFEHLSHKPRGWMDEVHAPARDTEVAAQPVTVGAPGMAGAVREGEPRDDDERFIVGLVLTYYRRHPQRARTRLLDLLGEVLLPASSAPGRESGGPAPADRDVGARLRSPAPAADEGAELWRRTSVGVAPLKHKK